MRLGREPLQGELVDGESLFAEALAAAFLLERGGRREGTHVGVAPSELCLGRCLGRFSSTPWQRGEEFEYDSDIGADKVEIAEKGNTMETWL